MVTYVDCVWSELKTGNLNTAGKVVEFDNEVLEHVNPCNQIQLDKFLMKNILKKRKL